VGSYTRLGGAGIWRMLRGPNGEFSLEVVAELADPSFLVLHPNGRWLYAVSEVSSGALVAFHRDPASGRLVFAGSFSTEGASPCHLALDPSGRWLAAANYNGANVVVCAVDSEGRLGGVTARVAHSGSSVHPIRQSRPHPHGVYWLDNGRELWVPDLGTDQLHIHRFLPEQGSFLGDPCVVHMPAGCGPRHLAVHPSGNIVYVLCELDSSLVTLQRSSDRRSWTVCSVVSAVPAGSVPSAAAEIAIDPEGRRLFCSNRGHDSIAIMDLEKSALHPGVTACLPSGGAGPRHFDCDYIGKRLIVGNQLSGTLTELSLGDDYMRHETSVVGELASPACVVLVRNPRV
jgi:6-phosphogluconolactonase